MNASKPIDASKPLSDALMRRHTEYLQIADTRAAETTGVAGDPRKVWGECMLMLLTEIFLNVSAALRTLGAPDDNLDALVTAALERAKHGRDATDSIRRGRAQ